jgi:hypothetical protein
MIIYRQRYEILNQEFKVPLRCFCSPGSPTFGLLPFCFPKFYSYSNFRCNKDGDFFCLGLFLLVVVHRQEWNVVIVK